MNIRSKIYNQFGRPTGIAGRIAGRVMAFNNKKRSKWTLQKLGFSPSDNILEIGYGPGIIVNEIASILTAGFIAGIDHSEIMYNQANRRNKQHIQKKKVYLQKGTIDDLAFSAGTFDIIFGSNVHFFWDDQVGAFRKLRQLIKPDGRLIMIFQPRWAMGKTNIEQIAMASQNQFKKAGFSDPQVDFMKNKTIKLIAVEGRKSK